MSEWKKKREAMLHYNAAASSYDAQYAEEQKAKIKKALQNLKPKKQYVILDLGCGTGLLFNQVAEDAKLLVGLDFSSKLLKQAKNRAEKFSNTALIRADIDHLPFKNQSFHYVFAITLLQNLPNPHKTVEEIQRVTKPDAKIVLTSLKKHLPQKDFTKILRQANFSYTLKMENEAKDYIAVCQKKPSRRIAPASSLTTYSPNQPSPSP